MISLNLSGVTNKIAQNAGMPSLPSNPAAQQQKQYAKGAPPKAGQKMENGLDIEMRFVENYKKHRGTAPYAQYANVKMPDGTERRVLAYDLGNGKNYIPQLHGPDHPFQSRDILDKIPSEMDVLEGRFQPNRGAENPAEASMSGYFADKVTTNYQKPAVDPLLGFTPGVSTDQSSLEPVQPGSTPPTPEQPKTYDQQLKDMLAGLVVNPKYKEATGLETKAAGTANKVLRPELTLQSALPLILGTLLAGDQGASVLKGGVSGIENATQMRQAESDIQTKAARDQLLAQAQGLRREAGEEDQIQSAKNSTMLSLAGQESREQIQLLKNQAADARIQATLRGQDMTQINKLAGMGPDGRYEFGIKAGLDPDSALRLAKLTPKELQSMSSVNLNDTRAADLKATLQPRLDRMAAATRLDRAMVEMVGIRKEGQGLRNALDAKELAWYDRTALAKISQIEALTDKALADAKESEGAMFTSDGYGKPLTQTSFTTHWGRFQTAIDKADAEIVEKQALVDKMRENLTQIEKEDKAAAAKDPTIAAFGGNQVNAKKIQKLRDSIDTAEAEIKGLTIIMQRNRANLDTLRGMQSGGAPATQPAQSGGKRTPQQQLEAYNRNKGKMSPEDRAKVEAALRAQGILK